MASAQLQNVYYERKAGNPRPCYICRRPTHTVLATLKTDDFLYTCDSHLNDPASLIPAPAVAPPGPSPEDIQKVIAHYKAKEASKASKDEKAKDKDEAKDGKTTKASSTPMPSSSIPTTPAVAAPTHRKFTLHRSMFEMRKAELRKREQGAKAKEVSKGLPQVPRGAF